MYHGSVWVVTKPAMCCYRQYVIRPVALSAWIENETNGIMKLTPNGNAVPSKTIYAVGAMTRGQIIHANMANGSARSTAKIAENLIGQLTQLSK